MRTLAVLLLALAVSAPSPARAVTIVYGVTALTENGIPGTGTVSVDSASFAPDADVPLTDLAITLDLSPTLFEFTIGECGGSAQGRVNSAGTGLSGIAGVCVDAQNATATLELFADGTLTFTPIPAIIFPIPGTYALALPEAGPAALVAAAALGLLALRRRRP